MRHEERIKAIARLARAERGRRNRQAFLACISSAIGSVIRADQLLDQDATDGVRAALSVGYASAVSGQETSRRVFFTRAESQAAMKIPAALADSLSEEQVLLWLKQIEDCGALVLTAGQVLRACEIIRAFDGDAVSILSEDRTQGFIFDKNEDDIAQTFEVSLWGSAWLGAAARLGPEPTELKTVIFECDQVP